MAGRDARQAVANFLRPLKEAVSCITADGFIAHGYDPEGGPYAATFQTNSTARLARPAHLPRLQLFLVHLYTPVHAVGERGPWKAQTEGWTYRVEDADGRTILAYHWHPEGRSAVTWPHLHIHGRTEPPELRKAHLPTARVSIEAVVRLLIADFSVTPRKADWAAILERGERAFVNWRTWSGSGPPERP